MTQIVLNISRGRGFPRSQGRGFVVKCQLVGQERVSQVASGETPFFGDVFSWDMSAALLKKLLDSSPAIKLHVYHFDSLRALGPSESLGHVLLHLKTVRPCQTPCACVQRCIGACAAHVRRMCGACAVHVRRVCGTCAARVRRVRGACAVRVRCMCVCACSRSSVSIADAVSAIGPGLVYAAPKRR